MAEFILILLFEFEWDRDVKTVGPFESKQLCESAAESINTFDDNWWKGSELVDYRCVRSSGEPEEMKR